MRGVVDIEEEEEVISYQYAVISGREGRGRESGVVECGESQRRITAFGDGIGCLVAREKPLQSHKAAMLAAVQSEPLAPER